MASTSGKRNSNRGRTTTRRKARKRPTKTRPTASSSRQLAALIAGARRRANGRKKNDPRGEFDLDSPSALATLKKRFAKGCCELTGIAFDTSTGRKRRWNSASLDRIDSARGYNLDNVRFVLWGLNAALADWGEEVFAVISSAWLYQRSLAACAACSTKPKRGKKR